MSRFGKKELIDIGGFEFPVYKSLLARERIAMLHAKSEAYDVALKVLTLRAELAKILKVEENDISSAISNLKGDSQSPEALRLIKEVNKLSDPDHSQSQYIAKAVSILVKSRLEPSFVIKNIKDLKDSFSFELSKEELAEYGQVKYQERLDSEIVEVVTNRLLSLLTDVILEDISYLIDAELLGISLEEFKAKETDKKEPETDPKN